MIDLALKYLQNNDVYGSLIQSVFDVKFRQNYENNEKLLNALTSRLSHPVDIKDITYHKYLKYTVYRIDQYIFSEKNPFLHYINAYIAKMCSQKRGENNEDQGNHCQ